MHSKRRIVFTADSQLAIVKPAGDKKPDVLSGYAILWNALSDDRGGYKVRLLPGSAKFTTPTNALFHHDFRLPLGTTDNGTLRIIPDDIGVKVEIDPPNTMTGRDVTELVRDKYIRGMSFAMVEAPKGNKAIENGQEIFNVEEFLCDEVTVTMIPSFTGTSIDVADPSSLVSLPPIAASRAAHTLQLEQFKFDLIRLSLAEHQRTAV